MSKDWIAYVAGTFTIYRSEEKAVAAAKAGAMNGYTSYVYELKAAFKPSAPIAVKVDA